ncbi:hypothetical protein EMPS_04734 [Entomortierella parvispora]|uniref:Uncharacterized protein n=1 Tax=Entomortierella parvispora TaxID=205924 RepID=A0A9P3H9S5_9FUNG|nr:hypothetical protein EMPS_04734 [Entomortierella parvispora]
MATGIQPTKVPDQEGHFDYEREHDAAPPFSEIDAPSQLIPGQERLDRAVGKAVGGTVIPSNIKPSAKPTSTKLDAAKEDHPKEQQPQRQAQPQSTQEGDVELNTSPDIGDAKATVKEAAKKHIVGEYPTVTRIG